MDDSLYGTRDKRGDWKPTRHPQTAPFWNGSLSVRRLLPWMVDYLWPWNAFHMATALAYWHFVLPDIVTMQTLSWG